LPNKASRTLAKKTARIVFKSKENLDTLNLFQILLIKNGMVAVVIKTKPNSKKKIEYVADARIINLPILHSSKEESSLRATTSNSFRHLAQAITNPPADAYLRGGL